MSLINLPVPPTKNSLPVIGSATEGRCATAVGMLIAGQWHSRVLRLRRI